MKGIIDRFEGEYAVVEREDRVMINIPRHELPLGAKEGDSIIQVDGEYKFDSNEIEERRKNIERLSRDLWE